MKDVIKFRLAARCEAAGRPNNEDNFQVDENLNDKQWGFTSDKELDLGEKGALLVVCDGMGGMNAGEVASAIAVQTIKDCFSADKLSEDILANPAKYIASSIVAADAAIKADAKAHPEHDGMGSTIVMAWLLGEKVYVGWCGDSRCYCYNPRNGLLRLSHDHSYVQELVDAGKLTEELAFDHPNSNIITRSLGDPSGAARPDVREFDLHNEDVIMLCSDGLCGCLRDNEIEEVIRNNQTSMEGCRDALWAADEAAGWHDNVTIAIAQVLSGASAAVVPSANGASNTFSGISNSDVRDLQNQNKKLKRLIYGILSLLVLITLSVCAWNFLPKSEKDAADQEHTEQGAEPENEGVDPEPETPFEEVQAEESERNTPKDSIDDQTLAEDKAKKEAERKEQRRLLEEKAKEAAKAREQKTFQSKSITVQKAEPVAEIEKETNMDEPQEDSAKVKVVNETETSVTVQVEDTNNGE